MGNDRKEVTVIEKRDRDLVLDKASSYVLEVIKSTLLDEIRHISDAGREDYRQNSFYYADARAGIAFPDGKTVSIVIGAEIGESMCPDYHLPPESDHDQLSEVADDDSEGAWDGTEGYVAWVSSDEFENGEGVNILIDSIFDGENHDMRRAAEILELVLQKLTLNGYKAS